MKLLNPYNICFLGKTGYGKSSLINGLFGTRFTTDPFYSCTKELYTVTTLDGAPAGYDSISVNDTPGIGEFPDDDIYQKYYEQAASVANVIVLVSTFSRTDAPEQELLLNLKPCFDPSKNVRLVIALNHIDSKKVAMTPDYEPWNMDLNCPSDECHALIEERIAILHEKFDELIMPSVVIPVCAPRNYGISELKKELLTL